MIIVQWDMEIFRLEIGNNGNHILRTDFEES